MTTRLAPACRTAGRVVSLMPPMQNRGHIARGFLGGGNVTHPYHRNGK